MSRVPVPVGKADHPRWRALRDVGVFHLKLFVGGLFATLVLSPLSLVAAGIDFLTASRRNRNLDAVLRLGRRLETWVNLYATLSESPDSRQNFDGHLRRLEKAARDMRETSRRG